MNTELKLWENSEIVFLLNCFFLYLSDFLRCSFFILYQVYHVSGKMLQSWCFYDTACGTLLHCDMLPTLCQFFLAVDIGIWMLFGTFLNSYFQREPIRTVKNSQFVWNLVGSGSVYSHLRSLWVKGFLRRWTRGYSTYVSGRITLPRRGSEDWPSVCYLV